MKKKAKSASKAKPAAKAKAKAKPKAKMKAKAKPKAKAKVKTKAKVKAKTKSASKKSHGLTVVDLFRMKQEREQAAQDPEAWKHKKDLPPQDTHHPEDPKESGGKKSGFGGIRHH
ncbi:MAG: hypothetical protein ACXWP1_11405 [Bdellovibrionota bacterium]